MQNKLAELNISLETFYYASSVIFQPLKKKQYNCSLNHTTEWFIFMLIFYLIMCGINPVTDYI